VQIRQRTNHQQILLAKLELTKIVGIRKLRRAGPYFLLKGREDMDKHYNEYEPSDEELREIEDLLSEEDEMEDIGTVFNRSRFYIFDTKQDWVQWLASNGIKW